MQVDGKWWWFFGEERFDTDTTRWLDLKDGVATDAEGRRGSYSIEGLAISIAMPTGGELVVRQAGPTVAAPIWLSGYFSDDDDPVCFAKDGDWAGQLTAANRARGGRYSTIDVSMYARDTPALAKLSEAETVEEIEAALAELPEATFTHA